MRHNIFQIYTRWFMDFCLQICNMISSDTTGSDPWGISPVHAPMEASSSCFCCCICAWKLDRIVWIPFVSCSLVKTNAQLQPTCKRWTNSNIPSTNHITKSCRRQPEDALQAMSMPKMARVNLKSIDYVLTYIVQMNCNDEPNIAYAVQRYSRYSTLTSIFLW